MNTVKIRECTGESDYSGNRLYSEKSVNIDSLSTSDLIGFLKMPASDDIWGNEALCALYSELNDRLRHEKDSELSFLYNTTGACCTGMATIGLVVLYMEMARRFFYEHPITE